MFTGIITGVGKIVDVQDLGASSAHGKRLAIDTPAGYLDDVARADLRFAGFTHNHFVHP